MKSAKLLMPYINLRRYREVGVIQNSFGLKGRFDIDLIHARTGLIVKSWGFENLITNDGLDLLATRSVATGISSASNINQAVVGTGTTPPDPTDTALEAQVGATTTSGGTGTSNGSVGEGFFGSTQIWLFDTSEGNGNLTEVGIRSAHADKLFCRQLILDEEGDPTVITKTSDFQLRVYYTLRVYYAPETTYSATVNGSPMNITRRLGNSSDWVTTTRGTFYGTSLSNSNSQLFTSALPAAGNSPTGSLGANTLNAGSVGAYTPGTYSYNKEVQYLGTTGNGTAKTIALASRYTGSGISYLYNHAPASDIVKTNTQRLVLQFTTSWGRH